MNKNIIFILFAFLFLECDYTFIRSIDNYGPLPIRPIKLPNDMDNGGAKIRPTGSYSPDNFIQFDLPASDSNGFDFSWRLPHYYGGISLELCPIKFLSLDLDFLASQAWNRNSISARPNLGFSFHNEYLALRLDIEAFASIFHSEIIKVHSEMGDPLTGIGGSATIDTSVTDELYGGYTFAAIVSSVSEPLWLDIFTSIAITNIRYSSSDNKLSVFTITPGISKRFGKRSRAILGLGIMSMPVYWQKDFSQLFIISLQYDISFPFPAGFM